MGEGAQSGTIGFVFLFRNANTNALYWEYANGAAPIDTIMSTFFTGYDNTWVHFAVVADYSGAYSIKFYRNGVLIQTSNMTTPVFPSTNRVRYLGAYDPTNTRIQNGNLDDIRIYNRGLSDAEIKVLYESTK